MKQFAFGLAALLATSLVKAQNEEDNTSLKPFAMTLTYSSIDELFLGLEMDNVMTLDLPHGRSKRSKRGSDSDEAEVQCTGWELLNPEAVYDDFYITRVEKEGYRGKLTHNFEFIADDASNVDGQDVIFENNCKQDEDGNNVQVLIHVKAHGPRDD